MLADILKQINEAENEADNIFARTKTQILDIEKDAAVKIEKINADTDAEIAAKVRELTPNIIPEAKEIKITPDQKKFDAAVKFAADEFYARLEKL
jgi:hypothetical protein